MTLDQREIVFTQEYEWKPKATNRTVPMCLAVRRMLRRIRRDRGDFPNSVFAHHDGGS